MENAIVARLLVALAGLCLGGAHVGAAPAAAMTPTPTCSSVPPPYVDVTISVEPLVVAVGEQVTVTSDVRTSAYVLGHSLVGFKPALRIESGYLVHGPVVLEAIHPGAVELYASATGEWWDPCPFPRPDLVYGYSRYVAVEVVEPPTATPTPTRTATPSATATEWSSDGDGCQVNSGRGSAALAVLVAALVIATCGRMRTAGVDR